MSFETAVVELGDGMSRLASAINELLGFVQSIRVDVNYPDGETAATVGVKKPGRGRPKVVAAQPEAAAPAPAAAVPAAPAPTPAPAPVAVAPSEEITIEAIRAACVQYAKANGGKPSVVKILKDAGGVEVLADLPADKFPAVYAALIGSNTDGDF